MRHWQAAGVLLLAFLGGTAGSRRSQLSETELEQRATGSGAVNQRASTFDPAATAQLDSAFLKDLTGENSTAANANKSFALNLTSPAGANLTRKTVSEVNHDAPVLRIPLSGNRTLSTKPRLSVQNSGFRKAPALDDKPVHSMQDRFIIGGTYGAFLDLLVGVRIATPGWGSGFNFCIDKWWGSFPKVGIVIPNPVAWILPEIANMASSARVILDFPVPSAGPQLGARVAPTSDGFVIWLPSLAQPVLINEVAFRYGVQITQIIGVDFGFGWARATCAIDFVRV